MECSYSIEKPLNVSTCLEKSLNLSACLEKSLNLHKGFMSVCCLSNLEIMRDGPPCAVTLEHVPFLELLHVFCINAQMCPLYH